MENSTEIRDEERDPCRQGKCTEMVIYVHRTIVLIPSELPPVIGASPNVVHSLRVVVF